VHFILKPILERYFNMTLLIKGREKQPPSVTPSHHFSSIPQLFLLTHLIHLDSDPILFICTHLTISPFTVPHPQDCLESLAEVMSRKVNRDYRNQNQNQDSGIQSHESSLDSVVSAARLLRTPDSVRTGGAVLGALRVIYASLSSLKADSHYWTVQQSSSRWLWLVRLCFDRRNRVRVLSLETLAIVLGFTRSELSSRKGGDGQGQGEGERRQEIESGMCCL
jgi:hypothetical protein